MTQKNLRHRSFSNSLFHKVLSFKWLSQEHRQVLGSEGAFTRSFIKVYSKIMFGYFKA